MAIHPLAGQPDPLSSLIDVSALIAEFHERRPDPADPRQRVAFSFVERLVVDRDDDDAGGRRTRAR